MLYICIQVIRGGPGAPSSPSHASSSSTTFTTQQQPSPPSASNSLNRGNRNISYHPASPQLLPSGAAAATTGSGLTSNNANNNSSNNINVISEGVSAANEVVIEGVELSFTDNGPDEPAPSVT